MEHPYPYLIVATIAMLAMALTKRAWVAFLLPTLGGLLWAAFAFGGDSGGMIILVGYLPFFFVAFLVASAVGVTVTTVVHGLGHAFGPRVKNLDGEEHEGKQDIPGWLAAIVLAAFAVGGWMLAR